MRLIDLISSNDLSKLSSLQMLARQAVEGFCSGRHRSPHKGFSVEFKEHRPYVRGDEIRNLDWKVFGKTDRLYIREYEEETSLRCTVLFDTSGSMAYTGSRSAGLSKHDYAVRVIASLAYLMLAQQDSVGLVTFDDAARDRLPPRSRPSHLTAILKTLIASRPKRETDLGGVFHQLSAAIPRRGLVVVVSDCFGDVNSLMHAFARFRHARHDMVVFQILDPDELDFPFRGRTQFRSLEAQDQQRLVDPAQLRRAYLAKLAQFRQQLALGCHRQRIDLVPLTTDRPYADALAAYLRVRRRLA